MIWADEEVFGDSGEGLESELWARFEASFFESLFNTCSWELELRSTREFDRTKVLTLPDPMLIGDEVGSGFILGGFGMRNLEPESVCC